MLLLLAAVAAEKGVTAKSAAMKASIWPLVATPSIRLEDAVAVEMAVSMPARVGAPAICGAGGWAGAGCCGAGGLTCAGGGRASLLT